MRWFTITVVCLLAWGGLAWAQAPTDEEQPQPGQQAPELVLKTPDGQTIKLSDLRGKVVLIDFWASWCGPCRKENRNLVKTYAAFKDKGFTVLSVSLDIDSKNWKKAIENDLLVWPYHGSELKGWECDATNAYKVYQIPDNFLVDENGVIIDTYLRGHQLDKALEQYYKKKAKSAQ